MQGLTRFLLIRHGAHTLGAGRIAGRDPVPLSSLGWQQANDLAERLDAVQLDAIYCSPVLRAQQTAAPLAQRRSMTPRIEPALAELDFGAWTGQNIDALRSDPAWRKWNAFRSGAQIPEGESMLQVKDRIVHLTLRLRAQHPDKTVALVTHGDVIRAAVTWFLGMPLDLLLRVEISLASVTAIALGDGGPWVTCVNHTGAIALDSP